MSYASSSSYNNRFASQRGAYKQSAAFSPAAASSKKVVGKVEKDGSKSSATDRSTSAVSTRAFSPELFKKPVKIINAPAEKKEESKGKEKEKEKVDMKSVRASSATPAASAPAKQGQVIVSQQQQQQQAPASAAPVATPAPMKSSAAQSQQSNAPASAPASRSTALVRTPATPQLHPGQIHRLLINAGKDSDVLNVWVAHKNRFDTGNYTTIFAVFTQLQSKKKGANNGYTDVLRGMVGGVIVCINDFNHIPLSKTIGSFENIKCSGQKLIRTFEKFIMKGDGEALGDFETDAISSIVSSYAYHRISGLAAEAFLLLLNTEVTENREPDALALSSMLKVFSKLGLKSTIVKAAFKTIPFVIENSLF